MGTNPYEAPFVQHTVAGSSDAAQSIVDEFHSSRGWMMLFVVLGGLSVLGLGLGGIGMTAVMAFMPETQEQPFPMWILGLVYFVLGAVYVAPVWRLYQLYAAINRLASIEPLDALAEVPADLVVVVAGPWYDAADLGRLTDGSLEVDSFWADDDAPVTQASIPPPVALGTGGPSQATLARASARLADIDVRLGARLQVAADRAVTDALVRAGATLRSQFQSKALRAKVGRCPNTEVFSRLGWETVQVKFATEDELLQGSLATLEKQYDDWTLAAQRQALRTASGIRQGAYSDADVAAIESQQDTDREQGWLWLAAALTALMRARLHDPRAGFPDERGEFDPSVSLPYGYFRSALAIAGGNAISRSSATGPVLTQAGTPAGGIGTGPVILDSLAARAGVVTGSYIWLHGGAAKPLEGHLLLDGAEFTGWDDPILDNPEPWPPYDRFFDSDHDGCTCVVERVLVEGP